jgi:hypothetical protein
VEHPPYSTRAQAMEVCMNLAHLVPFAPITCEGRFTIILPAWHLSAERHSAQGRRQPHTSALVRFTKWYPSSAAAFYGAICSTEPRLSRITKPPSISDVRMSNLGHQKACLGQISAIRPYHDSGRFVHSRA